MSKKRYIVIASIADQADPDSNNNVIQVLGAFSAKKSAKKCIQKYMKTSKEYTDKVGLHYSLVLTAGYCCVVQDEILPFSKTEIKKILKSFAKERTAAASEEGMVNAVTCTQEGSVLNIELKDDSFVSEYHGPGADYMPSDDNARARVGFHNAETKRDDVE